MTDIATPKKYAVKTGSNESIQNTRDAIRAQEPFKTSGSLFGERGNTGLWWGNRLNEAEKAEYERVANHILYVVISYNTPIAWAYRQDENGELPAKGQAASKVGWHVVDQKFSSTTTSHQSQVRSALGGLRRTPKDASVPYGDPEWMSQYQDEPIEYEGL